MTVYWQGYHDTDFHNSANWSSDYGGTTPLDPGPVGPPLASNEDVRIIDFPAGANQCQLTAGYTANTFETENDPNRFDGGGNTLAIDVASTVKIAGTTSNMTLALNTGTYTFTKPASGQPYHEFYALSGAAADVVIDNSNGNTGILLFGGTLAAQSMDVGSGGTLGAINAVSADFRGLDTVGTWTAGSGRLILHTTDVTGIPAWVVATAAFSEVVVVPQSGYIGPFALTNASLLPVDSVLITDTPPLGGPYTSVFRNNPSTYEVNVGVVGSTYNGPRAVGVIFDNFNDYLGFTDGVRLNVNADVGAGSLRSLVAQAGGPTNTTDPYPLYVKIDPTASTRFETFLVSLIEDPYSVFSGTELELGGASRLIEGAVFRYESRGGTPGITGNADITLNVAASGGFVIDEASGHTWLTLTLDKPGAIYNAETLSGTVRCDTFVIVDGGLAPVAGATLICDTLDVQAGAEDWIGAGVHFVEVATAGDIYPAITVQNLDASGGVTIDASHAPATDGGGNVNVFFGSSGDQVLRLEGVTIPGTINNGDTIVVPSSMVGVGGGLQFDIHNDGVADTLTTSQWANVAQSNCTVAGPATGAAGVAGGSTPPGGASAAGWNGITPIAPGAWSTQVDFFHDSLGVPGQLFTFYIQGVATAAGPQVYGKHAGVWKLATAVYAKRGGAWVAATEVHGKQGGVWKQST